MGGHSVQVDLTDLEHMSDRELVNAYLNQEEERAAYAYEGR
jgi:hypothetical protein